MWLSAPRYTRWWWRSNTHVNQPRIDLLRTWLPRERLACRKRASVLFIGERVSVLFIGERVSCLLVELFIGTRFSNLYTAVDTPAEAANSRCSRCDVFRVWRDKFQAPHKVYFWAVTRCVNLASPYVGATWHTHTHTHTVTHTHTHTDTHTHTHWHTHTLTHTHTHVSKRG